VLAGVADVEILSRSLLSCHPMFLEPSFQQGVNFDLLYKVRKTLLYNEVVREKCLSISSISDKID
jgi:hypothetical protein